MCVSLCRRRHDTSRLLAPAARVTSPQVHNSDLLLAFGVRFDDRVTGKVCTCRFFKDAIDSVSTDGPVVLTTGE